MPAGIEQLGNQAIWFFCVAVFAVVLLMVCLLVFGWWVSQRHGSVSLYTKKPLLYGTDMAASLVQLVEAYMRSLPQPENKPFDVTKAALCEDTGRLFPNAVVAGTIIHLKWDFLKRRYPGNYVSWGSLTPEQQAVMLLYHGTIEGFQTEHSSTNRLPQDIEPEYIRMKPGPLYIDLITHNLLGWQVVPGTDIEVLVVQLPRYASIDETL